MGPVQLLGPRNLFIHPSCQPAGCYSEPIFLSGCNGLYGYVFLYIIGFPQLLIYISKACSSPRLILPCFISKKRVEGPGGEGAPPLVCFGRWRLLRVSLTGCIHHICTYLDCNRPLGVYC
jgi:hypothetical protein